MDHLVVEASSHGLQQKRVDGLRIRAAAFTNLTRDHMDHHGTMAAYLAAKSRLFAQVLPPDGTAVLNADLPEFQTLRSICDRRGIAILDYGRKADALRLLDQVPTAAGQTLTVSLKGVRHRIDSPLIGAFQADNLLAALGLWHATGGDLAEAADLIGSVQGAPGRMQLAGTTGEGAAVYVDYAHTPDALEKALAAADVTLDTAARSSLNDEFHRGVLVGDRREQETDLTSVVGMAASRCSPGRTCNGPSG